MHWRAVVPCSSRLPVTPRRLHAPPQSAVGASGVLLYADRMTRAALERLPRVVAHVREGRLLVVGWEAGERQPLLYNYDQVGVRRGQGGVAVTKDGMIEPQV